jgi:hypothetical protein
MILLSELLEKRGLNLTNPKKIKLLRHKDGAEADILKWLLNGDFSLFEKYQRCQSKERFSECEYIISFLALGRSRALFLGVYKVCDKGKLIETIPGFREELEKDISKPYSQKAKICYTLEKRSDFEYLEQRVIIDWGNGARKWVQNYKEREVLEIRPKGFVKEFTGYFDIILEFNELKAIIDKEDSNPIWKNKLSSVSGVYLILDSKTGKQYVGSAYGEGGIWSRWKEYVEKDGHGDDKQLKKLIKKDKKYNQNFQFSILETLPSNWTQEEVIAHEKQYKDKLGTRKFGLNSN